jgi:hypothetical protein
MGHVSESTKVTKATKMRKTYLRALLMFFVAFVDQEI